MGKGEELLEAVKLQDFATVTKLLNKKSKLLGSSKKVHINYQDNEGFSALHQASVSGNHEIICLLLDAKADVDIQDVKGLRPLHYAAWQGKLEPVTVLLTSNGRANVTAKDGNTPLHLSAQYGHYSVCELLLQYGGDPGIRNNKGKTALDLTCEFGVLKVTELFLNSNSCAALLEPSAVDSSQMSTPLHLAAANGHRDVIRALLQTGIDINWLTKSGTCLHEAVVHGKPEVVRLLIDCGVNVTKTDVHQRTAFDLINKSSDVTADISSIRQMLTDARPGAMKVRATQDFKNVYDATSLAFKTGMLITVLERNSNGNWKGKLRDPTTGHYKIGYFPAAYVEPQQNRHNSSITGSDDSGIHPYDDDSQSTSSSPNSQQTPQQLYQSQTQQAPYPGPRSPITMDNNHNVPHKYINMEPQPNRYSPQNPLRTPTVANPSYEDVIMNKSHKHKNEIPHMNNPGYEDVLVNSSTSNRKMAPLSYSNTISSSYSNHSTVSYSRHYPVGNAFYAAANHLPVTHEHTHEHNNNHLHNKHNHRRQDFQKLRHNSTGSNQVYNANIQVSDLTVESDKVVTWLSSVGMHQYAENFVSHGYDMITITRMNPADLTAIGVTKPTHRKKISAHITKLTAPVDVYNHMPSSVHEWCQLTGLPQYASILHHNGINTIDKVITTTWEDLQEMNIEKLGHQKKLLLGIAKLKQIAKNSENSLQPISPVSAQRDWAPKSYHRDSSSSSGSGSAKISPSGAPMSPFHGIYKQDSVRLPPLTPVGNNSINQKVANMAATIASRQNSIPDRSILERPKRLLPMSSFQENAELSDELQKALSKRQNIINNAPKEKSPTELNHPEPVQTSTNHSVNNFKSNLRPVPKSTTDTSKLSSANGDVPDGGFTKPSEHKTSRQPSMRGPKPPPPKRTVSLSESDVVFIPKVEAVSLEEPIEETADDVLDPPVDDVSVGFSVRSMAQMLEPHTYNDKEPVIGRRSSGNKTPNTSKTNEDAFVFPKPSDFNSKPPVQSKPSSLRPSVKPTTLKKPWAKQPKAQSPDVPHAKKFDLSVLDHVTKSKQSTQKQTTSQHQNDAPQDSPSSDEFEWPAPPPSVCAEPCSDPLIVPRTPESKTCFENDDDQGTVKRRPISFTRAVTQAPPLPPKDQSPLPPTTKAASEKRMSELDDILNELNCDIAQSSEAVLPNVQDTPALPPKQSPVKMIEPKVKKEERLAEETNLDSGKSTQQVLDDIGSMFEDLELELNDLLK